MSALADMVLNGAGAGAVWALVGLGFVIIYKSTGVINFAQGGLMLVGAYVAYNMHVTWGWPFWVSIPGAVIVGALVGMLLEFLVLRHMIGKPPFSQLMVTLGLLFVLQEICANIWGLDQLDLASPWGNDTVSILGAPIRVDGLWTIALAAILVTGFFVFFRYSRIGLSMRATALDFEAAAAQGINPRTVYQASWAIAGAVAALAAVMAAAAPNSLTPALQLSALIAFPAIILGGLDSPAGAIVGGLVIGIGNNIAARYFGDWMPWLGQSFAGVFPYVIMIAVLLVRPYGLFGTKEVRRI